MKIAQNIFPASIVFTYWWNGLDKLYRGAIYWVCDISGDDIKTVDRNGGASAMENIALTESTYYILLSLYHPQHGYGIMQQTEQLSGGRVRLAAGTLYGALNSLCEKGWIRQLPVERGSRKKEYQLTAEGLAVLKHELARLQQLVANGESILKEE